LDLTGEGKTVWKGFYGRFHFNPSYTLAQSANPVATATRRYQFRDLNTNLIFDAPQELGSFLSSTGGGGLQRVDPDIEPAYGDEVSTHLERQLTDSISSRFTYVYKNQRNGWAE